MTDDGASLRSGDPDVWSRMVADQTAGLVAFARTLGARDDAEDLVQEAFLRAYRSRVDFRGDAAPLTWIRRIIRNLVIDRFRSTRSTVSLDEVDRSWADDATTVDGDVVLAAADDRDLLWDALSRLPHSHRGVVVLHDIEEWTLPEIADLLEIGLPAAKQRLRRGRMALVTALAGENQRQERAIEVPLHCWDARRHVSAYLDGDLDAATRAAVEAHLASCPTCPPLVASLVGATDSLRSLRDSDTVVSPDLAQRIVARLDEEGGALRST